jgi:hypothetical protein
MALHRPPVSIMVKAVIANTRRNTCIFFEELQFERLLTQVLPLLGIKNMLWNFESK